jgi:hypothetical protein
MPSDKDLYGRVASGLASYLDQMPKRIAKGWTSGNGGEAPFAAPTTYAEKLAYYTPLVNNLDGSPNVEGRQHLFERVGVAGYAKVVRAVLRSQSQSLPDPIAQELPNG